MLSTANSDFSTLSCNIINSSSFKKANTQSTTIGRLRIFSKFFMTDILKFKLLQFIFQIGSKLFNRDCTKAEHDINKICLFKNLSELKVILYDSYFIIEFLSRILIRQVRSKIQLSILIYLRKVFIKFVHKFCTFLCHFALTSCNSIY